MEIKDSGLYYANKPNFTTLLNLGLPYGLVGQILGMLLGTHFPGPESQLGAEVEIGANI